MATLTFTILGCGSSGGVPRLGGHWGACDPENPKNTRRRCSMLVERTEGDATTRVLIDTSPDLRSQLLDAGVGTLDAVIYTHSHADHVHGIDDLRMIVFNMRQRLPVWADGATQDALLARFGYAFVQPEGSSYPAILDLHTIDADSDFTIEGAGGSITFTPFEVEHGSIDALGFRVHDLAYLPDVSDMKPEAWRALDNLDCWVLDALRYTPHPTHAHVEKSLGWLAQSGTRRGVLTNMHIDIDHDTIEAETPDNISAAYDGMTITYEI
ncbi:MBL fold metallo-hydrolase [Maritimibacter sp. DP07]|jgi:phosphoribosyl 1,2-cyclic phosphate phosphodiesterase|uniref:MBL fold metallo-hydrolase n=1 Tax=Maritimibacter harenae TaxID=2606218 RepID=A0A845M0J0_9RHOB|nr:MBL fold metallo-hydrolase [Maritimibacter harenae]MZR12642.1 MBL fold metallo-hydrolase [Maritimibacter harenae]